MTRGTLTAISKGKSMSQSFPGSFERDTLELGCPGRFGGGIPVVSLGRGGECRGLLSQGTPNSLEPQLDLLMGRQWVKIITH